MKPEATLPSCSIDFETASDCDLKEEGLYRYAAHPSTRVLCLAWQRPDMDQPAVWAPGEPFPDPLLRWLAADGPLAAWNAAFEREIWERLMPKYGAPRVRFHQWRDTQAYAAACNLPRKLEHSAKALVAEQQKDTEGARVMKRASRNELLTAEEQVRLRAYCAQDVRTEMAIAARVPSISVSEQIVWQVSESINRRGIPIDLPFVNAAVRAVNAYQRHCEIELERRFNIRPTQVIKLRELCAHYGVETPDLRADTVDALLLRPGLPEPLQVALKLRQQAAAASVKKYAAIQRNISADGRLRGMLAYCGAGQTGRWSGRVMQPHNLPRPDKRWDYETTRAAMLDLQLAGGDWRVLLDYSPEDPMAMLVNALRATIGGHGEPISTCDWSAIEARVLAWIAGEEPVLDVFRKGGDIYLHEATGIYGREITKADEEERQIGKVATLALGYGGGVGAFQTMARGYGVVVDDDRADEIKVAWRKARLRTVALWAALDALALRAMNCADIAEARIYDDLRHDYEMVCDRLASLGIRFVRERGTLQMTLPSGRRLFYPAPKIEYALAKPLREAYIKAGYDEEEATARAYRHRISYATPGGSGMTREGTYGGKLTENLVQAISRDLLARSLVRADMAGTPLVLHVHDELVAEGDHRQGLQDAMLDESRWAAGLPLAAEAKVRERFWK